MYISQIKLNNYRNFKHEVVCFNDGINVIIGHNNAGKTNLLKALALILDNNAKRRLDIHDFNKNICLDELKTTPPKVSISLTLKQSDKEDIYSDDLATVANWLTRLEEPYEATLIYEFYLPEKETERYVKSLTSTTDINKAWKIIQQDFLRLYTHKLWGGSAVNQTAADNESLQKFDFQFLDAIRDVERDMLSGRNTLLRDVLDFFMDYDIKSDKSKNEDERLEALKLIKQSFSETAEPLLSILSKRMELGKDQILSYAKDTGASFNKAIPNFEGGISEFELFSVLKLIVEYETGIKIPATHNGLGYNNLIFMSLLLSKMQVNSDGDYLGSNAKVFPVLAIEEPEAHLHPAMQYQFLKFLLKNKEDKKVRQIFVTTHSTHITSSVSLDEMICLHNKIGQTSVGYPGKAFEDNETSKKYVQRFFDATKSDMLFAQKVILVEGIAEQLLLPVLSRYLDISLEENHIAVINVGGRYFEHFLYLFNNNNSFAINKKVVCLTDRDPERKPKTKGASYSKCYPYEYGIQTEKYDYKQNPSFSLYPKDSHSNIAMFSQDKIEGKTFEYDLVLHNPSLEMLITHSMKNQEEIKKIMRLYVDRRDLSEYEQLLRKSDEKARIVESLTINNIWSEEQKKKALIASRYLNSVGKGENALELSYVLADNLNKRGTHEYQEFIVPNYIKEAITWIVN
ncbi:AAA family ATPase [Paenibacillus polymyxa]|uniref:AAA family ATPase n=1 Tax=Paenibacillus polymyxa TaxID=1406 RepID=UPI00234AAF9D|nr:AAA family ATPase [Paenibacillus polymyxa]WCM60706.1 AAA family ATPase [Paenibacillus polymyxa]